MSFFLKFHMDKMGVCQLHDPSDDKTIKAQKEHINKNYCIL